MTATQRFRTRPDALGLAASAAAVTGFAVAAMAIIPRGVIGDGAGVGGGDAHAYWAAGQNILRGANLYTGVSGGADAYLYPPPFAQVVAPITAALSPTNFVWLWRAVSIAGLIVAAGGWRAGGLALLVFPPAIVELDTANVHFVLAAMCALVMRGSSQFLPFAFVLKLAGGGAFPFALQRNLRALLVGGVVATAAVTVSALLAPSTWLDYASFLSRAEPMEYWTNLAREVPLVPRLAVATAVGAAAIRWPFLLPLAFVLSMPIVSLNSLAILVCLAPGVAQLVERGFVRLSTRQSEERSASATSSPAGT